MLRPVLVFRQMLVAAVCLGLLAPAVTEARVGRQPTVRGASSRVARAAPLRLRARAHLRLLRARLGRLAPVRAAVERVVTRRHAKRLRAHARASLRRLSRRDRRAVRTLLAEPRVRNSVSARYAVGAFLLLRSGSGEQPLSYSDMKEIVGSRRWTSTRLRNLGRVLSLARDIAVRENVSPKVAYARALKRLGIYGKVSRGVCGA